MSNRKWGENPHRRKPKVSSAMSITGGLGAPKDNRAFGHGRPMDSRLIFRPLRENLLERQRKQVGANNWISVLGSQECSVGKSAGLALMPPSGFEKTPARGNSDEAPL